jgi:predicted Zn finger-like uncharacterized protein
MLIVCPNCATSYDVDVATLRPNGRQVRCVRCRTVWHAALSHADRLIAAAEALAPVRRTVEAVAEASAEAAGQELPPEHFDAATSAASEQSSDIAAFEAPADGTPSESAGAATSDDSPEMESPPIAPDDLETDRPPAEVEAEEFAVGREERPEAVESVAARRFPRRSKARGWRWSLSRLQWGILALIVLDAIVIGWRVDFVRILPQTASFYAWIGLPVNLRGLDFDSLATSTEQHENVPILVVEGDVVNNTHKIADVPHLRFSVRNAAHQEIYSWTAAPPRAILPPGEGVAFRTRLASPPPDAHDVLVRFLNRSDMMAGAR